MASLLTCLGVGIDSTSSTSLDVNFSISLSNTALETFVMSVRGCCCGCVVDSV